MTETQIENVEIKKVGKFYENKKRPFSYIDIPYENGKKKWADASKYLPQEFDLCHCKTKDRTLPGWYTGISWDGLNLKPQTEVLFWKLNYDI